MADVIEVPSIWDYLGQGIQRGAEAYNARKAEQKDTEDKQVTFMNQLLTAGLINQDDYNKAIQGTRFNQIKARPSKAEQAEGLAATGKNPTTGKPATAVDYNRLGLLTPGDQAKDTVTGAQAQTSLNIEDIRKRWMAGEPISGREAVAAGVQTDEQRKLADLAQSHTHLKDNAEGFLDQALAPFLQQSGGRIPTRGWEDAAKAAAAMYNQHLAQNKIAPDDTAEAYMHKLILDRLIEQKKLDIQHLQASNVGLSRMTPVDRMFQSLTGVVESRRKALDDMLSNNPVLGAKLQNPNTQNDPEVIRYRAAEQGYKNAQNAQAALAQGVVPEDITEILKVDPTFAPNTTGQQIVGPGTMDQDKIKRFVDMLKNKTGTLAQLHDAIGKGVTQEEYDAIVDQYNKATSKPTPAGKSDSVIRINTKTPGPR